MFTQAFILKDFVRLDLNTIRACHTVETLVVFLRIRWLLSHSPRLLKKVAILRQTIRNRSEPPAFKKFEEKSPPTVSKFPLKTLHVATETTASHTT